MTCPLCGAMAAIISCGHDQKARAMTTNASTITIATLDNGAAVELIELDDKMRTASQQLQSIATLGEPYRDEMLADAEKKLREFRQRTKRLSE